MFNLQQYKYPSETQEPFYILINKVNYYLRLY